MALGGLLSLSATRMRRHGVVACLLLQALTSPSGTLSTIASGTTVSVAESPVGGLALGTGAFRAEPAEQQVCVVWPRFKPAVKLRLGLSPGCGACCHSYWLLVTLSSANMPCW